MFTTSGNPTRLAAPVLGACVIAAVSFTLLTLPFSAISCLLGWAMLAIAIIDARDFIIPDWLSLTAIPAGLLASGHLVHPDVQGIADSEHVAGALAGFTSLWVLRSAYFKWRGHEGLGLGDVKLAAAAGAWTGLGSVGPVVLLAAVSALAVVGVLVLRGSDEVSRETPVPFGVYLAPAIWIVWVWNARTL